MFVLIRSSKEASSEEVPAAGESGHGCPGDSQAW